MPTHDTGSQKLKESQTQPATNSKDPHSPKIFPKNFPRCRTCAHWDLRRKEEGWYNQNDTCSAREFLPCKRIPHKSTATEIKEKENTEWGEMERALVPDHKDTLALAADPDEYSAWLEVSADFGCVHHEKRTE